MRQYSGTVKITSILVSVTNIEVIKINNSFWFFVEILISILAFFVIGIIFNLAQVILTLLLIFLDCSNINFCSISIR